MAFGTCKLTGTKGTMVKCHLLPKALTKPPENGEVRVEGGLGRMPVPRFDSWYDKTLVTRQGEDLLEQLDTYAITELRRNKLVWSSWGEDEFTCPVPSERIDNEWGLRKILFLDPARMRLFSLSLLWRAAKTDLPGFDTIELQQERLQLLSRMLLSKDPAPFEVFPVHLVQLRTRGGWHNQSPIKQVKRFTDPDGRERAIGTYRFYMDGLIIHIDDELDDPLHWRFKGQALGEAKEQVVLTRPYEKSFQESLIDGHMLNAMTDKKHVKVVERILGRGASDHAALVSE